MVFISANFIAMKPFPAFLPDTVALPVLLCQSQTFDMGKVYDVYPLEHGSVTYETYYGGSIAFDGAVWLDCVQEARGYLLRGKTDCTARSPLAVGESPALNDWTVDDALEFIRQNVVLFGGDADADLRINRAIAMSGLCYTKSGVITAGGASCRVIMADPDNPVSGGEKGLWLIELAQYLHGARVFPRGPVENYPPDRVDFPNPVSNTSRIMDEENFQICFQCLREEETLTADAVLLPWDTIETAVRELIENDELKCVTRIELGYTVTMVAEDWQYMETFTPRDDAQIRYVLVPEWTVMGYVRTQDNAGDFIQTELTRDEVLQNNFGYNSLPDDDRLCLNAATGQKLTYADLFYALEP